MKNHDNFEIDIEEFYDDGKGQILIKDIKGFNLKYNKFLDSTCCDIIFHKDFLIEKGTIRINGVEKPSLDIITEKISVNVVKDDSFYPQSFGKLKKLVKTCKEQIKKDYEFRVQNYPKWYGTKIVGNDNIGFVYKKIIYDNKPKIIITDMWGLDKFELSNIIKNSNFNIFYIKHFPYPPYENVQYRYKPKCKLNVNINEESFDFLTFTPYDKEYITKLTTYVNKFNKKYPEKSDIIKNTERYGHKNLFAVEYETEYISEKETKIYIESINAVHQNLIPQEYLNDANLIKYINFSTVKFKNKEIFDHNCDILNVKTFNELKDSIDYYNEKLIEYYNSLDKDYINNKIMLGVMWSGYFGEKFGIWFKYDKVNLNDFTEYYVVIDDMYISKTLKNFKSENISIYQHKQEKFVPLRCDVYINDGEEKITLSIGTRIDINKFEKLLKNLKIESEEYLKKEKINKKMKSYKI